MSMSGDDKQNNKINPIFFALPLVIGLSFMATKFVELGSATNDYLSTYSNIENLKSKSSLHDKYLSELMDCWDKPFGDGKQCSAQMLSKYEASSDYDSVKTILSEAGFISSKNESQG